MLKNTHKKITRQFLWEKYIKRHTRYKKVGIAVQKENKELAFPGMERTPALAKQNASEFVIEVAEENWIIDEEEVGEVAKAMKIYIEFFERMKEWKEATKLTKEALILQMLLGCIEEDEGKTSALDLQ